MKINIFPFNNSYKLKKKPYQLLQDTKNNKDWMIKIP